MEIVVLGPVAATREGEPVPLPSRVHRTLLALLALRAPRPVPVSALIDGLWGDDPPPSADRTLRAHCSRLRRALDPDSTGAGLIAHQHGAYRLNIGQLSVDAHRFSAALARARDAGTAAAGPWRDALDEWSGDPLAGCADTFVVTAERVRLSEERLAAVDGWASAMIEAGGASAIIGELEIVIAEHPLREASWARLVRALTSAGRPGEAAGTYHRARQTLVDVAGLEPGPELRAAGQVALAAGDAPIAALGPRHLRRPRNAFVAREHELDSLIGAVRRAPLVTVTGPGGCGKTRFAIEAAVRLSGKFDEGAVFADLTSSVSDNDISVTLAGAFGVRLPRGHKHLVDELRTALAGSSVLLVIDNCEHLHAAAARIVDELLDALPRIAILATSRRELAVEGEQVWRLSPLATSRDGSCPSDAARLFTVRAAARGAPVERFDAGAIERLCESLDGLPLAIELAAARALHLSPDEIVRDLARRPDVRSQAAAERHRSLDATLRWSDDLLLPAERQLLRHLGIFAGSFTCEHAAAVARMTKEHTSDLLASLVAQSLVIADPRRTGTRYRLLEVVRTYAAKELERSGGVREAARRHRDWFVDRAKAMPVGQTLLSLPEGYALEADRPDLRRALANAAEHEDAHALASLAVHASGLQWCPGGVVEADEWIARALAFSTEIDEGTTADLLAAGAFNAMAAGRLGDALARLLRAETRCADRTDGLSPLISFLSAIVALWAPRPGVLERLDLMIDALRRNDHIFSSELECIRACHDAYQGDLSRALERANNAFEGVTWDDASTTNGWLIHAAILYMAGEVDMLGTHIARMRRIPADVGPGTHFVPLLESLLLAIAGRHDDARFRLAEGTPFVRWVRLPLTDHDMVIALAILAGLRGDQERSRELLQIPGLGARHPGTVLLLVHSRERAGLAPFPPAVDPVSAAPHVAAALAELR